MLTDTNTQNHHADCLQLDKEECTDALMRTSMQHNAAQWMLFGLTDIRVLSLRSGFSRLGALMSITNSTVLYSPPMHGPKPTCGIANTLSFEALYAYWGAGI